MKDKKFTLVGRITMSIFFITLIAFLVWYVVMFPLEFSNVRTVGFPYATYTLVSISWIILFFVVSATTGMLISLWIQDIGEYKNQKNI